MSNFKEVKVQFYDGFLLKLVNMVIGQPWLAGLFNDRVNYTSRMRLALTCSHAGQPGQSGQRRMSALPVAEAQVDHGFPRSGYNHREPLSACGHTGAPTGG